MALKSLETKQQISIQALIRSWDGKLTWDLLVTKIESSLGIATTRQTLDKYANIKHEYKQQKQVLRGKPVSSDNKELLSYLQKDVELAEKVIQLEAQLAVAHSEIGKLQAFIQKLSSIGKTNPSVMDVFQKTLRDVESSTK
ncbi:hypothetical protein ACLVXC_004053 [Vibrio alginolyticus]|uniref:hypothetical protein n=1 Tax=Vibrio sp. 1262-1 TaxID=3074548 RepID=UPI0004191B14|nr:hypothetical protein [Vibrio sp. 1262-1]EJG0639394.1 hypothetical protein [Vibrio parahaemolyticus]EJG0683898.1 hypothetical protein [Vibrio parahaemolyticus]EJG0924559.1 hypothetical protein [Vibrio parahaemolyticus]EJG1043760.1 hypothetical protein [Vibrio parahaemolyticus]EJG1077189.1 hypothetical protein [Vibrio parahaemolyticus]